MRETLLIGIAVLIGAAGAAISIVLPAVVWYRRRKMAAGLYGEFLEATPDIIGFRYRRMKRPFGEGFLDAYSGEVGSIAFRLDVEIVPFRKLNAYRLRLEKPVDGELLVHERSSQAEPTDPDPLAIIAKTLCKAHAEREKYLIVEAN